MKKKIDVMITAFRDGFQSVYGARVLTKDFIPAVEAARDAGISHFESGGGARFQSLFFYCNENAFDMMDAFRKAAPEANLQTLARGNNVVGLESQSRDVVKLHAELFKKHGTDTIRNFDALNDVNNLIFSGKCIHEAGLKHEVSISMMSLPPGLEGAHDPDFYEKKLKDILDSDLPFDSVCFKDASGTSTPAVIYEVILRARKLLPKNTKIVFHTHDTAGTAIICYKAALDAGADQLDLSMAPASGGTCQPDIISMWHALRGTDYDLGIDINKMLIAEEVFKDCMKDYYLPPEAREIEPLIPFSPMPGGALTANTQMLRDNNIMDKYPDIIKAMSETVRLGGFGTSVTPVSQFYFQQAFNNVMLGEWKKIAEGYGRMVLGYFGRTPCPPDPDIMRLASEQLGLKPTTRNVLDINDEDPDKGVETAKKLLKEAGIEDLSDENIFIASTCKSKGIDFLLGRAEIGIRLKDDVKKPVSETESSETSLSCIGENADNFVPRNRRKKKMNRRANDPCTVNVNGREYTVRLKTDGKAVVNGKIFDYSLEAGASSRGIAVPKANEIRNPSRGSVSQKTNNDNQQLKSTASDGPVAHVSEDSHIIKAQMPGKVMRILVNAGDHINHDETIMILEAMKMEMEIKTPISGTVTSLGVSVGDFISGGQPLASVN